MPIRSVSSWPQTRATNAARASGGSARVHEDAFKLLPPFGAHSHDLSVSARYSHARANAQSLCTVRSDTSSVCAISSIDNPRKTGALQPGPCERLRSPVFRALDRSPPDRVRLRSGHVDAVERNMHRARAPRRLARRRRAMSTSTRRIICADTPKKCWRFCQRACSQPSSRRQTSLTSPVACSETFDRSPAR